MVELSKETIKLHCLQVYRFIIQVAKEAESEIEVTEKEYELNTIINKLTLTLGFSNKIIEQLSNYTQVLVNDIKLQTLNPPATKKEPSPKRSKLSLKKEKDPEFTQDEFLEIYKIDMTEDLNAPYSSVNERHDASSDRSNSISDKSDNDSNVTDDLINEDIKDEDEQDILNNITCDSSIFGSDSEHSLFSIDTVILSQNEDDTKNVEYRIGQSKSNNDKAELLDIENKDEVISNDLQLKECYVVLSDCEKRRKSKEKLSDLVKELRSIENLVNLDNLNRKRKLDEENIEHNRLKKKRQANDKSDNDNSDQNDSNSDQNDSNSDQNDSNSNEIDHEDVTSNPLIEKLQNTDFTITSPERVKEAGIDILQMLLESIVSEQEPLVTTNPEDDSGSTTDVDKNRDKNQTADKKVVNEKNENDSWNEAESSDDVIEISALDKKKQKRKQWWKNRLLTEKLTDGSTDEEKENNQEERRKSRRKRKTRPKSEIDYKSYGLDSSSDTDRAGHRNSSDSDSLSIVSLCFSSDSTSDNDIEFVKAFRNKSKDEEDSNEDELKSRRRNIRMIKSDALLTETTKKARKEEEDRRERLHSQNQLLAQVVETEDLILDVDKETKRPLIVVDRNITNRLKAHQKEGVRFMWTNCYENVNAIKENKPGTGCILAHCMGLGKSLQVVALINTLFSHEITNTNHVLIACPLSTVLNWENEFKICDSITENKTKINRFLITDGKTKAERYRVIFNWHKNKGVLILGYDSFHSLLKTSESAKVNSVPKKVVEALLDPGPDLVICDEGHLIKNGALNRAKTLAKIRTKRRIILTGTPMQNNLTEYFYMVDFVKPNLLGTKKEFSNRFINPIDNGGYDDSTEADIQLMRKRSHVLHDYLKDSIQRYEISELQKYLPEKLDYVLFIRLSPLQTELYKACLEEVQMNALVKKRLFSDYTKLRDIWTHPCILRIKEQNKAAAQNKRKEVDTIGVEPEIAEDPGEWWHSKCPDDLLTNIEYGPKIKVMLEIVEHSVKLGDKVVIFGCQLSLMDAVEYFLQQNGWRKNVSYLRMDGTVPPDMRLSYFNQFNLKQQNRLKLFLLSVQVGGLGLNLTAANRIILMDVNFNPAHDTQSIFRTYRFGQEKRCTVYRLVSIGTMEEVIYERSVTKLAVSLRVVDEHQISRHYKYNDLQKMYRFDIYSNKERPVVKLPVDEVLASILEKCKHEIFKYHEHQNLLENRPEEQLNEDEQRLAWDEFRREQEAAYEQQMATNMVRLQNLQILQNPIANAPSISNNSTAEVNSETTSSNIQTASNTTLPKITPSTSIITQQKQVLQPTTTADEIRPEIVFVASGRLKSLNAQNQRKSVVIMPPLVPVTSSALRPRNPIVIASTSMQQQPTALNQLSKVSIPSTSRQAPAVVKQTPISNKQQHINIISDANRHNFGRAPVRILKIKKSAQKLDLQRVNQPQQETGPPPLKLLNNYTLLVNKPSQTGAATKNSVRATPTTSSVVLNNGLTITPATSDVILNNAVTATPATPGVILNNGLTITPATSGVILNNGVTASPATSDVILNNGLTITPATSGVILNKLLKTNVVQHTKTDEKDRVITLD